MSRRAGRLGWLLVWAVVFCDIGTSVYYAPGVLHAAIGDRAWVFVAITLVVFVLLAGKYLEVSRRFNHGGGVVSVADRAMGPWLGGLGGQMVMVDYFLTVGISAMSAVYYLDSLVPLGPMLIPAVLVCLVLLGAVNVVGIKESATVSLVLALPALVVNLVVIGVALAGIPVSAWATLGDDLAKLGSGGPAPLLVGYAGAWLAFSGLESIAQLSPAMKDNHETPRWAIVTVVVTVLLTAPALTVLAMVGLEPTVKDVESTRLVAALAGVWGGVGLKVAVVLTASALLLFAANTAILGNYHVMTALSRRGFVPEVLAGLSRRFQTPWRAIVLSVAVPAVVVVATGGDMGALGGLYAFGLLGAFTLTSLGLDVLRWREGRRDAGFWAGVLTTAAVAVAFVANLYARPHAAVFGGSIVALGMAVALGVRTGWFERQFQRIPGWEPPPVADAAHGIRTLAQVRELVAADTIPNILVASRGAADKIFKEACERARARGLSRVFVVYVDEVPGLFFPQLASPTPEGLTVLEAGAARVRAYGMEPVAVWMLSHGAAEAVAECAEACKADVVVIGATQRTVLWQALRGRFIQDLLAQLPAEIRVSVVG